MNKYLSIITSNVHGLNAPIKRHRVAEWIRKHDSHTCCLQKTYLRTKDLHRLKEKGWKKYSKQMDRKKSWGSNTYIRQNRLQNKAHEKRHRRTLHNTQGKNRLRRHKHYIHICTQHRSTQIHKEKFGGLQERYIQYHTYTRVF